MLLIVILDTEIKTELKEFELRCLSLRLRKDFKTVSNYTNLDLSLEFRIYLKQNIEVGPEAD